MTIHNLAQLHSSAHTDGCKCPAIFLFLHLHHYHHHLHYVLSMFPLSPLSYFNTCTCFFDQMITSSVQEDGYELSLTLTFALRGGKDPFVDRQLGISTHKGYLSQHTERDSLASGSDEEIS